MGHIHTPKNIYLTFKSDWAFCILSGNPTGSRPAGELWGSGDICSLVEPGWGKPALYHQLRDQGAQRLLHRRDEQIPSSKKGGRAGGRG